MLLIGILSTVVAFPLGTQNRLCADWEQCRRYHSAGAGLNLRFRLRSRGVDHDSRHTFQHTRI
jgi:hypothetical protein